MVLYRRDFTPGATYFFTATLRDRRAETLTAHVDLLAEALAATKCQRPFRTIAMVVLPEHLHAIWRLPELDPRPPALGEAERASAVAAHDGLVAALRGLKERFPPQGRLAITGHAHIDLAWLWQYRAYRQIAQTTGKTFAGPADPQAAITDFTAKAQSANVRLYRNKVPLQRLVSQLRNYTATPARIAPLPTKISGFSALAIAAAACSIL